MFTQYFPISIICFMLKQTKRRIENEMMQKDNQNNIKRLPERESTFCTMERAWELLHLPWLKVPQVPRGVPKLANSIEEMT